MARSIIEYVNKAMNQPRQLTSSDDMDNLTQAGFYTQSDGNIPANAPSDNPYNAGIVVLKARGGAETIQIWFSVNSSACWLRFKPAFSSWSSWHKVMMGGVISKLLSEVMTASGWRHDECDQSKTISISGYRKRVRHERCCSKSILYCYVIQLHNWHERPRRRRSILGLCVSIRQQRNITGCFRKISFVPSILRMGNLGKLDCDELDALEVA